MTDKTLFAMGAGLTGLGVVLGAFGAHALEPLLVEMADGPKRLENWQTATLYLYVHAIALMLLGTFTRTCPKFRLIAALLFVTGILLFSFGLYGWVRLDQRWMVMVVPVGGLAFVAGWVTTVAAVWFHTDHSPCSQQGACGGKSGGSHECGGQRCENVSGGHGCGGGG